MTSSTQIPAQHVVVLVTAGGTRKNTDCSCAEGKDHAFKINVYGTSQMLSLADLNN